jgi:hypothetical protein
MKVLSKQKIGIKNVFFWDQCSCGHCRRWILGAHPTFFAKTIHLSQGLSLYDLIFYLTNVKKYCLTYTTLSYIWTKIK